MKIIAGLDKSFQGEVVSPDIMSGIFLRSPSWIHQTARIVMEGVQPIVDILKEYEDVTINLASHADMR